MYAMNKTIRRNSNTIYARQIAFFAAFILPVSKFLETPSLLAQYARGDILLPALLHFLLQGLIILGVLYASSKSEKSILKRLEERFGKWTRLFFFLYAAYFLFAALLPLLDLEKFVYAAFFDTAPTTFAFGAFFLLSAFVCAKGIKSVGRFADLSLFLFLLPFLAVIAMGFFKTDLTRLLPFFGTDVTGISQAFQKTTPHFADAALLLPLLCVRRYEQGDGKKIMAGYGVGALCCLIFFAVFFGLYSSLAPREHYAFLKIAQYFPALDVVGRLDLIFIYLLSTVLLFYTCLPLLYAVNLTANGLNTRKKPLLSAIVSVFFFLFILFVNRYYNGFYKIISGKLAPVFWIFAYLLPLCLLLLPKENNHA